MPSIDPAQKNGRFGGIVHAWRRAFLFEAAIRGERSALERAKSRELFELLLEANALEAGPIRGVLRERGELV